MIEYSQRSNSLKKESTQNNSIKILPCIHVNKHVYCGHIVIAPSEDNLIFVFNSAIDPIYHISEICLIQLNSFKNGRENTYMIIFLKQFFLYEKI